MAVERELVQDHAAVWVALVKAARVHSVVSAREEVVRPEPARRLSRRQPDERQHKKTRRPTSAFYQLDTSTTTSTTTALPKQSEYFLLSVAHNLTFLEMLFQFVAWVLTTGRDFLDREVIRPLENEVSFFFFPLRVTTNIPRCVAEGFGSTSWWTCARPSSRAANIWTRPSERSASCSLVIESLRVEIYRVC